MVGRFFLLCCLVVGCAGCAAKPTAEPAPIAEENVVYIVPFLNIMTPPEIEEGIFDRFVDSLNAQGAAHRYEFVILKEGLEGVDRDWLAGQHYITGEIFGYVEESGCCSTAIRVKSRIRLFQPGDAGATLKIEYPREVFFEHDLSTLEAERRQLAEDIAAGLAADLLQAIAVTR